ncbi:hypothetical protein Pla110_27060 [Polystyrenella longa]|uniref:Uncharacterized protein n=1 Tax=Polystyrenella longa TaxID=2528007 RepID=A0A518CP17_9PLAN|nr:hypothetical protein Pla110_27060 [Polystyrenella longa]
MSNPEGHESRLSLKDACLTIVLALSIPCLGFLFLMWNFNQPPSAYYKRDTLTNDITRAEVISFLGRPSSDLNGGIRIAYSRTLGWVILYISFDDKGMFLE